MTPVVGAGCAGRVAVWVTTSARFPRRGRFLNRELLACFEIHVQKQYSGKRQHDDAHETTVQPIPASGMSPKTTESTSIIGKLPVAPASRRLSGGRPARRANHQPQTR